MSIAGVIAQNNDAALENRVGTAVIATSAIRLFTGFDQREAVGWHAFTQSVIEKASAPVAITPLVMDNQRDGSNAFTYSRFLVPWMCNFEGWAIFVDGVDMICVGDIAELAAYRPFGEAVKVVKHDYKTRNPKKYRGTVMEKDNHDYPRKNWSSVIIWDCAHFMNRCLTPEYVAESDGSFLHRFGWLPVDRIGTLPFEWNWLVDEYGANTKAKLLHFTAGIPAIPAHRDAPHAQMWQWYSARSLESPQRMKLVKEPHHG